MQTNKFYPIKMNLDISKPLVEKLEDALFAEKEVNVFMLRLDKVHPVLSGNKIYKLHYFFEEVLQSENAVEKYNGTILTFGGVYSNHLTATAYACKSLNLKSIGIVRGERHSRLTHTLKQCESDGMNLHFVNKLKYQFRDTKDFQEEMKDQFGNCLIIPEGGYHSLGAKGASLIMHSFNHKKYTHICTATGTGTTLAGILAAASTSQQIISVPVLKNMTDINERLKILIPQQENTDNLQILDNYHFNGYAKKDDTLFKFMNQCWLKYNIPLDFVYTGKMMYAVIDRIKNNYFRKGSEILCLHTGGLQGNISLPLNTLLF